MLERLIHYLSLKLTQEEMSFNQKVLHPILISWSVINFSFCILFLILHYENSVLFTVILSLIWSFSLLMRKKVEAMFIILMILSNSIFIAWFMWIGTGENKSFSQSSQILQGMTLGISQVLLISLSSDLRIMVFSTVILVISKFFFFEDLTWHVILMYALIDAMHLFYKVISHIKLSEVFRKYQLSEQSLKKFQSLITHHLPNNLVILSKDFKRILFANSCFVDNFDDQHKIRRRSNSVMKASTEDSFSIEEERYLIDKLNFLNTRFSLNPDLKVVNSNWVEEIEKRTYDIRLFPLNWDGQKAVALMMNDITSQRVLGELQNANVTKEMAISTVAHELRNPMSGLLGLVHIMDQQVEEPHVKKSIAVFKTNIEYMLNLLNSILDLQQIKADKLRLHLSMVNIAEVVHNVCLLFEFQCSQKKIFYKVEIAEDVPELIFTDKQRLIQVLINLSANALKFTFKGGIILKIELDSSNKDKIKISVKDTGIGIKEEDVIKLFQAFGKLESSINLNQHGVGLGLLISTSIVKILNRIQDEDPPIKVESKKGEGSVFSFKIPVYYYGPASVSSFGKQSIPNEISTSKVYKFGSGRKLNTGKGTFQSGKTMKSNPKLQTLMSRKISFYRPMSKKGSMKSTSRDQFETSQLQPSGVALLVDDNPFNLVVMKQMIADLGLDVIIAYHGEEAIEMLSEYNDLDTNICIIFMDSDMPVMDGVSATQEIVKMMDCGEIPRIPVIGLSGNSSPESFEKCLNAGMSECYVKPLTSEILSAILTKYRCI